MSLSSSGAPVTRVSAFSRVPSLHPPSVSQETTVAFVLDGSASPLASLCLVHASNTAVAPAPSPSMLALPLRRTIIWACVSSKNEDRRGLRMAPLLSCRSTSTHAGFDSVRSAALLEVAER